MVFLCEKISILVATKSDKRFFNFNCCNISNPAKRCSTLLDFNKREILFCNISSGNRNNAVTAAIRVSAVFRVNKFSIFCASSSVGVKYFKAIKTFVTAALSRSVIARKSKSRSHSFGAKFIGFSTTGILGFHFFWYS